MAKGLNSRKSNKKSPSNFPDFDMDDEIDVFHKQRDIVPLDLDEDIGDSDEDNDQHVFEIEDGSDEDDSADDTRFAAKIAKQQKSLKAKIGGAADETHDDDEDEEEKRVAWGRSKNIYYDNSKGDSSEDEEAEVLRLQNEKNKIIFKCRSCLEDDSEEEEPPTFENLNKGKSRSKPTFDDNETEVVMKDPNSVKRRTNGYCIQFSSRISWFAF